MTDAELKETYQNFIDEYVGFEIDWNNPPGPAALALESLETNHEPSGDNIQSEKIDDLSISYGSKAEFYKNVMQPLNTIRKMKWLP